MVILITVTAAGRLTVHELSIARNLVKLALKEAEVQKKPVVAVHVRIGALSGVVDEALETAYEYACEATALAGSRLIIENVPVKIFCADCNTTTSLPGIQAFTCSKCGKTSADLREGRELDLVALEVSEPE